LKEGDFQSVTEVCTLGRLQIHPFLAAVGQRCICDPKQVLQ